MRKISFLLFAIILICCYYFRYDILFHFQYRQLIKISCKNELQTNPLPCFTNKFWAHRVNSLKRFKLLKDYFQGFESDVYFDSSVQDFWVWHPPGKRLTNLRLAPLLQVIHAANKNIWLDMRGVDSSNFKRALDVFEKKMQHYDMKKNIVVELYDVAAANYFSKKGFVTSLNIPGNLFKNKSDSLIQALNQSIAAEVKFISNSVEYTSDLKRLFPGKKIITWSISFNNYFHIEDLQKLQDDPTINIILVNVKSRYYD